MPDDTVQLNIRMPSTTKRWIKMEAARLDMSVQDYVLATVERRLRQDQKRAAARAMKKGD